MKLLMSLNNQMKPTSVLSCQGGWKLAMERVSSLANSSRYGQVDKPPTYWLARISPVDVQTVLKQVW